MKHPTKFIIFHILVGLSWAATAQVYVSPWVGFTGGGRVKSLGGERFNLDASSNVALSIETTFDKGRIGFFYTRQSTTVDELDVNADLQYLHFQSSIYYPLNNNISSYIGAGLGASYVDADWVENEVGFSASIMGGLEFNMTDSLALNTQLRWLGTVVDNDTSGVCNLPTTDSDSCIIRFDTSWMNQFSANAGVTLRF
ncbi:outer membrane protein [Vibrio nereis]|uniref:outer membrane protein n=1 Tax=Vibrio nereis TaxID=693 RepID=UPI0024949600|nr:outer membrane beta-barrel protein [Vibrio nereis]